MKRILLAAKFTSESRLPVGGVQTWIDTVRKEFIARGHQCEIWASRQKRPEGRFDYGVVANLRHTKKLLKQCDRFFAISHGIIPEERPSKKIFTAYTSEEVRDHWVGKKAGVDGPIIRQPIDLSFWAPGAPVAHEIPPETFVHYGHGSSVDCHAVVADAFGMGHMHLKYDSTQNIRDVLRQAKAVMATGRAACEAMACGAPVVICDNRNNYQRALLDPDISAAMTRNYSGRGGVRPTEETLTSALKDTLDRGADWSLAHVKEHHDVRSVADQILSILESR